MFKKSLFFKRKVYMDYAAATPFDPTVEREMSRTARTIYANPGGLHSLSLEAKNLVEDARTRVARMLSARSEEIIFTRGGTESCWMGILGTTPQSLDKLGTAPLGRGAQEKVPHVITSTIEHAAVRETLRTLRDEKKITLTEIPVNEEGIVDLKKLKEALRPETILVSIMYVNNEIGTMQPLSEIMKIVRHYRKEHQSIYPYVHTDAIQATNYFHLNTQKLGVDLMSISGSKIYGPKSTGVLFKKSTVQFHSPLRGGDQEFGVRPGTEDISGIVGFARALEITNDIGEKESHRLWELQQYFFNQLEEKFPECRMNGSRIERVPNNIHVSFKGVSGERLVIELDASGICASAKSACQSNNDGESHVLEALYGTDDPPAGGGKWGSVRFSMGRQTRQKDIDMVIRSLQSIMNKIKKENDILHLL